MENNGLLISNTKILNFLLDTKKQLFVTLPVILCLGGALFLLGVKKKNFEKEFAQAKTLFLEWEKAEGVDANGLAKLKKVIHKHPELRSVYDNMIIQRQLSLGEVDKELIEKAFSRGHFSSKLYEDFAKNSVLIAEGDYEKALASALELKASIPEDKSHYGVYLQAFNLLRIAMLHQELGQNSQELVAWDELRSFALKNKEFHSLLSHFTDRGITLDDYITYRQASLGS